MKISIIVLALCIFGSCSDGNSGAVEGDFSEADDDSDTLRYEFEHGHEDEYVYRAPKQPDSVEVLLQIEITKFMEHLKQNDFLQARKMLHPDGFFYYTIGQILPAEFDLSTLKKRKGQLRGAYEMTDEYNLMQIDSMVTGLFWLDSLRKNYTENVPAWYDEYGAVGYGFSGNHSSDHIYWDALVYTPDSIKVHIAYIHHNSPEIDHRDILMIEFFEDKNGDWKIYAVGNLEWTP